MTWFKTLENLKPVLPPRLFCQLNLLLLATFPTCFSLLLMTALCMCTLSQHTHTFVAELGWLTFICYFLSLLLMAVSTGHRWWLLNPHCLHSTQLKGCGAGLRTVSFSSLQSTCAREGHELRSQMLTAGNNIHRLWVVRHVIYPPRT